MWTLGSIIILLLAIALGLGAWAFSNLNHSSEAMHGLLKSFDAKLARISEIISLLNDSKSQLSGIKEDLAILKEKQFILEALLTRPKKGKSSKDLWFGISSGAATMALLICVILLASPRQPPLFDEKKEVALSSQDPFKGIAAADLKVEATEQSKAKLAPSEEEIFGIKRTEPIQEKVKVKNQVVLNMFAEDVLQLLGPPDSKSSYVSDGSKFIEIWRYDRRGPGENVSHQTLYFEDGKIKKFDQS